MSPTHNVQSLQSSHIRQLGTVSTPQYHCRSCNKTFDLRSKLRNHQRDVHQIVEEIDCHPVDYLRFVHHSQHDPTTQMILDAIPSVEEEQEHMAAVGSRFYQGNDPHSTTQQVMDELESTAPPSHPLGLSSDPLPGCQELSAQGSSAQESFTQGLSTQGPFVQGQWAQGPSVQGPAQNAFDNVLQQSASSTDIHTTDPAINALRASIQRSPPVCSTCPGARSFDTTEELTTHLIDYHLQGLTRVVRGSNGSHRSGRGKSSIVQDHSSYPCRR